MLIERLSPKQLDHVLRSTAWLNIADGPVRAGKTVANNVRWLEWIEAGPRGALLMVGKTYRTLKRNVLDDLAALLGPKRWVHNKSEGEVRVRTSWGWRTIYLAGANDERAEEKIRGMTLAGAYLNEVSLYPESVFNQILARCSIPGAKIFGDTNPDSPYHWLYRKFLSREDLIREGRLRRFRYRLEDNPYLDREYIEHLKRVYVGLWYKRFILGEWVVAEGAIYDQFEEDKHVTDSLPEMIRFWVSVDYGTTNPTVFLLVGEGVDECLYVVSEYRWDSSKTGYQKTDLQYADDMRLWLRDQTVSLRNQGVIPFGAEVVPERIYVDPSAASFIVQLHRSGLKVVAADNTVIDGIRSVAALLYTGRLKIHKSCQGLIEEIVAYVWDPKAQEQGRDEPLKQKDHGPDALRYAVNGTRHIWMRWLSTKAA